jgi:hypothetical protein
MPTEEIRFKDLREAVTALNKSGLLQEEIKLVGLSKEDILKQFMLEVGTIPDVKNANLVISSEIPFKITNEIVIASAFLKPGNTFAENRI